MLDDAIHERLRQAVAAGFDRQTEFLADLVRFPSVRGQEAPLQDWMARQFARRGYSVDRYPLDQFTTLALGPLKTLAVPA